MPFARRLPLRLVVLLSAVALPVAWYSYVIVNQAVTGGVHHRGDYTEVDLKSLGDFAFKADSDGLDAVPARFRALDGQRVRLEGFMTAPSSAGERVRDFQFVYNVQMCCFNGPPLVQERVFARCTRGKAVPYLDNNLARLTGILHVKPIEGAGGTVTELYTLDVESVEKTRSLFFGIF